MISDEPLPEGSLLYTARGGELPDIRGVMAPGATPEQLLRALEDLTYTHIVVTAPDGTVLAESRPDPDASTEPPSARH